MSELVSSISFILAGLASTVITIIAVIAGIAGYVYCGYVLMCMGRKAGNLDNRKWMAFIPFAQDAYYLKMVRRPWWQMFFFGTTGFAVAGLLILLVTIISSEATIAAAVIMAIYLVGVVVFTLLVKAEVYHCFGFNKWIVLAGFAWLEMLIAFSSRIRYESNDNVKSGKSKNGALVGISGVYAGQVFELSEDSAIIIGRDPSQCTLVFPEYRENISRHHCDIRYCKDKNAYGITDYSKNGTYVNGEKVPSNKEKMYRSGSLISLGGEEDFFRLK